MIKCGKFVVHKHDHGTDEAIVGRCKCWSCEVCRRRNKVRLQHQAASGVPTTFLTLTSRLGSASSPDIAAQRLVVCWRLLRQQLIRDGLARHLSFIAVFERTKRGWPHLHILMRAPWLPHSRISELMAKWADSPIVDIRPVDDVARGARYVAKYLAKDPRGFLRCRRYWSSRDWIIDRSEYDPKPRGQSGWTLALMRLPAWIEWLTEHGYIPTKVAEDRATLRAVCPARDYLADMDEIRRRCSIEIGAAEPVAEPNFPG